MEEFLTYMHLLTPLHTGGSADEGNLMGIAREVHTEFPYLPSSSLRGRIRAAIEQKCPEEAGWLFGQRIKEGSQPTEGEVWFADGTLLFFPIASLNYHIIWITCPLWLERWSRWLDNNALAKTLEFCNTHLAKDSDFTACNTSNRCIVRVFCNTHLAKDSDYTAITSIAGCDQLYLQTALLDSTDLKSLGKDQKKELQILNNILNRPFVDRLSSKLVILCEEDCLSLLETGLQREVRVALEENSKTVKGGSFRAEEAIPPETILFFPWGLKPKTQNPTGTARQKLTELTEKRLQFGGLEGLGRGWATLITP